MAGEGWEQRAWLARVRTGPGGGTCGAGLLVDAEHVVTCAHVVQQAGAAGPGGRALVDFPQLPDAGCWAEVLTDGWAEEAGTRGDTAVLRLADPPVGACPVPVRAVTSARGQEFAAYGFPAGYGDAEVASEGRLGLAVGREWVQLEVASSLLVQPGYSGAAVWSDELGAVVALLITRDAGTAGRVAFAVPMRVLACQWALCTAGLGSARCRVNAWYTLHEQAGDLAGYLRDVQLAWQLAESASRQEINAGEGTSISARFLLVGSVVFSKEYISGSTRWTVTDLGIVVMPWSRRCAA